MITAMAGGGLVGCFASGPLVRRVGHARTFAALMALVVIAMLLIAVDTNGPLWVVARALYGFAAAGLFVVSQSWLNDACDNAWRGKVIATFYMSYVVSVGLGAFLLRFLPVEGNQVPLMALLFGALAILPVSFTRLPNPPPPESVRIAVRSVWAISPVGLVSMLVVGGLTMLVQGFSPIYAAAIGYDKNDIGLMLFLMQFGMIFIQLPLGALSDRMDRRIVLVIAVAIVVVMAGLASQSAGLPFLLVIAILGVWAGATETIYAVANAHANDRTEPRYYVSLSSTLLVAWSLSGLVIPGVATALTELVGPRAYMFLAMGIAGAYGLFVLYRITRRTAVPEAETEPYQQVSPQMPVMPDLELYPEEEEATPRPETPSSAPAATPRSKS
jgi:MFS family permease